MPGIKKLLVRLLPLRNMILLESVPDFSDNTLEVYDELVRRGIDKRYRLVWITPGEVSLPNEMRGHNTECVKRGSTKYKLYNNTARLKISGNRFLVDSRPGQRSVYLCHGAPGKKARDYYSAPEGIDYIMATSEEFKVPFADSLKADVKKVRGLGFPRNDVMKKAHTDLSRYFGRYAKYVIWYPTVRQFANGRKTGVTAPIPLINNAENAAILNRAAAENDVLIIVKPHFAQDLSNLRRENLTNIRFINDAFFAENHLKSYEFVGSGDALLTDYSSVYYDYLLADKPIGLIWEDVEDYRKNPGFIDGYDELMRGGEKIYTMDDMKRFLADLTAGRDRLKAERQAVCRYANAPCDGNATGRVTDFILELLK